MTQTQRFADVCAGILAGYGVCMGTGLAVFERLPEYPQGGLAAALVLAPLFGVVLWAVVLVCAGVIFAGAMDVWDECKGEEQPDVPISDPSGFRHESHIGWDPANGFEIRGIPPEWKKPFAPAGITKSELNDAGT